VLDVERAARCAEARDGQDRGAIPRQDVGAAGGQQAGEQRVEAEQAPQSPCEPDVAEVAQVLQEDAAELDESLRADDFTWWRIEQRWLWSFGALQAYPERGLAGLLAQLEFAQIGDDALA
jgi:hypothetical protein